MAKLVNVPTVGSRSKQLLPKQTKAKLNFVNSQHNTRSKSRKITTDTSNREIKNSLNCDDNNNAVPTQNTSDGRTDLVNSNDDSNKQVESISDCDGNKHGTIEKQNVTESNKTKDSQTRTPSKKKKLDGNSNGEQQLIDHDGIELSVSPSKDNFGEGTEDDNVISDGEIEDDFEDDERGRNVSSSSEMDDSDDDSTSSSSDSEEEVNYRIKKKIKRDPHYRRVMEDMVRERIKRKRQKQKQKRKGRIRKVMII